MSHEIRADYNQTLLLPPRIEDWVGEDHPARFVRAYVDSLDLKALGFSERKSQEGRPNYSNDLLLKVLLYGWLTRVRSSRKMEKACRSDMGFIFLTGNNPPDHNSIWRFFDRNKKAFENLFKGMVKVAQEVGLLELTLHAVDGTKIAAAVSGRGGWHKEEIDKALGEFEKGMSEAQVNEKLNYRLPKELREEGHMKERIEAARKALEEAGQRHLAKGEPEARMMKVGKGKAFAYNAQAVVDSKAGVVVAADVTNDASDDNQLVRMIEEAKENLGGKSAQETVADGGYNNGEQLGLAEEKGFSVVVGKSAHESLDRGTYDKRNFKHDADKNVCVCPRGVELEYERTRPPREGRPELKVYRCKCKDCPAKRECSGDGEGRMIEIGPYEGAINRQRAKRHEVGRELLKKRSVTVEPVFGWIKWAWGFTRWTVRGMAAVKAQWYLMCTINDLFKLYRLWLDKRFEIPVVKV